MTARFTTWGIGSMGGTIGRGIPSFDVALSIATDYERYPGSLKRVEVEICEVDEGTGPYIEVVGEGSRGLGVWPEERCVACGGRPHWTIDR